MKICGVGELGVLHEVKKTCPCLPILIAYASGSVRTAVTLMKIGAFDLIKEPLSEHRLLCAIRSALEGPAFPEPLPGGKELTPAEKRILCLILQGKSNRETAAILNRSIKTVEVHRSHIMHKFGVDNAADLVRQAVAMGLTDWPSGPTGRATLTD
jgi:two-component system response regulator FixJ